MRKNFLIVLLAVGLLAAATVRSQTVNQEVSQGGVFLPLQDYAVAGQWTYLNQLTPWVVEGLTLDAFEARVTFTEPTADREFTYPDASGTVTLGAFTVVAGEVTLDGSNPTSVTTGLASLTSCAVTDQKTTTPGDDPVHFTIETTGTAGQLDIYAWGNNGSDPTLVASTDNVQQINYLCVGTP